MNTGQSYLPWTGDDRADSPTINARAQWRAPARKRGAWTYFARFALVGCCVIALAAALGWAGTWLAPPRSAGMILIGAGYEDNLQLPQNVYGWNSLQDIFDAANDGAGPRFWGRPLIAASAPTVLRRNQPWDRGLDKIEEETAVVVFSLHGATDLEGPYLLPIDADASDDPSCRLRIDDVLARLARLPAEKNKVLVLDVVHLPADLSLGMLHNDFAKLLAERDKAIRAIPRLAVIVSSGEMELSWPLPAARRTAFLHFFLEGLRGLAPDLNDDGRLNLWELHRFSQLQTMRWVSDMYQASQEPLLLPQGEEGRRRAAAINLTLVARNDAPLSPPALPEIDFEPLVAAWNQYRQWDTAQPHPSAYSPGLWRHYQAAVLRYEQLLAAGDPLAAARMRTLLADLDFRLNERTTLASSGEAGSFAMPAALGAAAADVSQVQGVLNQLWQSPPQQYTQIWQKYLQSQSPSAQRRGELQRALFVALYQQAQENPPKNLPTAAGILLALEDAFAPRASELHWMLMLAQELQNEAARGNACLASASADNVGFLQLSMQVRAMAEQAAAGVGLRHPLDCGLAAYWVAPLVAEGDALRRQAEDLVFAGAAHRPQAESLLIEARGKYEYAIQAAQTIAEALAARNQIMADLPWYSRAIGLQLWIDADADAVNEHLLERIASLWSDAHALNRAIHAFTRFEGGHLQAPSHATSGPAFGDKLKRLAALTASVQRQIVQLRGEYHAWLQSNSQWTAGGAAQLTAAPLLPGDFAAERVARWRQSMQGSLPRLATFANFVPPTAEERAEEFAARTRQTQLAAKAFGRVGLEIWGQELFDALPVKGETYEQIRHRLNVFNVETNWPRSLAVAGGALAKRWRLATRQAFDCDREIDERPRQVAAETVFANARRSRMLLDVTSATLLDASAERKREILLGALMARQAGRAVNDGWYCETGGAQPYYQAAANNYLAGAAQLESTAPIPPDVEKYLAGPDPLAIAAPPKFYLTTEPRIRVACELTGGSRSPWPAGMAATWSELKTAARGNEERPNLQLANAGLSPRPLVQKGASAAWNTGIDCAHRRGGQLGAAVLTQYAYFRGRTLSAATVVDTNDQPAVTWTIHPVPATGTLAVRASAQLHEQYGTGQGAVVIVLDCSGSMGPPPNQTYTSQTKFNEATAALRQVLQSLPAGTKVSIWTFGQAMGADKTVVEVERTIRRAVPPTAWNPRDSKQLETIMRAISYPQTEPWNESPIVRAMLAAKADLDAASGLKTMLVLTDGMDNRFANDTIGNPKGLDIPTVLSETFDGSDILVNIVGFKVVDAEEAQAEAQFSVVETFSPPGKFYRIDQTEALAEALRSALRQRLHYWIQAGNGALASGVPTGGIPIALAGAGGASASAGSSENAWLKPGLAPGQYQLVLGGAKATAALVNIERGERLLIEVASGGSGLGFRLLPWAQTEYPWQPFAQAGSWRVSIVQNVLQRSGPQANSQLSLLAGIEQANPSPLPERAIELTKPTFAWFEVEPNGASSAAPALRCWRETNHPAAAYRLISENWPMQADGKTPFAASVRAWWTDWNELPPSARLNKPADGSWLGVHDVYLAVDGGKLCVAEVAVERHFVETSPGELQEQPCLVVRVIYAPGEPCVCMPAGVEFAGKEHRLYPEIGRYSALFWPATDQQIEQTLRALQFTTLSDFKRSAAEQGNVVTLDRLPLPEKE